jgi:BirA family biotin operon repressor/biotin-[acetyl-CoA-carboxylase] ligase
MDQNNSRIASKMDSKRQLQRTLSFERGLMHEIHLSVVDSTNTYAKNHSDSFPKKGITCITAEEQTSGRGRYQRKWISPKGVNIYATFYFTLSLPAIDLISLSQLMACSVAKLLLEEGFKPKIKWPNDIQLDGKKISGILTEIQFHPNSAKVFLGIGINVNLDAESARKIGQPATSLMIESGKIWDKNSLLKKLQIRFEEDLEIFKKNGFSPFWKTLDDLLALKGKTIHIFDGEKEWIGICHSLTREGQLNLLLPDQTIHTILSGDIRSIA